jgi:hypothetical protein
MTNTAATQSPAPFKSQMTIVLEAVPEEHRDEVGLHANLLWNMGGGRPSDAARQAVREYERLGIDAMRKQHDRDHTAALASCPCSACAADLAKRLATR